jgi:hypothetical protein
MDMRKEIRRLELVPVDDDGNAVIEYGEEEWIESVAPYNETFIQVIVAGMYIEPEEDDVDA